MGLETQQVALGETLSDPRTSAVSSVDSITPARDTTALVGARMHHFRVLRPLGTGGMGAVYVAEDTSLEREVALKVLHGEYAQDPALRERFVREARAQARLHHPNVVQVYYIGQEKDQLFFAMELVDGLPLDRFIEDRKRPLSPDEALDAMEGIARALREAHQRGFVHRDIKPGNLLRAADGTVKLADFGLARPLTSDSKITQAGMVIGSPAYMSPEQALGGEVDHRSDMYSLGATFFHLLTGRPLYMGPTPIATITKHVTEPLPGPEVFTDVPRPVISLLTRMLAKKPEDRFATYDELLASIEAARPRKITYVGFPTRAAVSVVDQLTFFVLAGALKIWSVPVFTAYVVAALAWKGQTLGDKLFGVQVTREDGGKLSPARALVRHVVCHWLGVVIGLQYIVVDGVAGFERYLSHGQFVLADHMQRHMMLVGAAVLWNTLFMALYAVGMVVAVFDKRRRALHDRAAGSVVTYAFR